MAKQKRRIIKPVKESVNLAKPVGRAIILGLGGLIGIVLTFTTVAIALVFAWLTVSGGWEYRSLGTNHLHKSHGGNCTGLGYRGGFDYCQHSTTARLRNLMLL